ncbi:MAG: hypothetical protein ACRD3C_01995 [Vicinamibacterales bacterium]
MSRRLRVSLGVLAVVLIGVSILAARGQLTWLPAGLTGTTAGAEEWTAPRTPWGDPDLQGIYNYGTSTPLQRPRQVSDKQVLSDEEATQLQADLAYRLDRDRRDGGSQADVSRSYNDAWMDPARMRLTADKRTSLIVDPPEGRIPARVQRPLTPAQEKARAAADLSTRRFNTGFQESYLDMDVGNRCIIRRRNEGGGHPYLPAIYNNMAQILQSPGYVVIYAEMIHFARVIPVDGRPHLPESVETWLGDARGRWEGNTLVVETKNFIAPDNVGRTGVVYGNANPKTFHIVERFTRVGPDTIDYQVTLSDPDTWTQPFTILVPWNKTNEQVYEYQCQELNYDMYHWLHGAREREKRGEKFDPNAPDARGGDGAEGG